MVPATPRTLRTRISANPPEDATPAAFTSHPLGRDIPPRPLPLLVVWLALVAVFIGVDALTTTFDALTYAAQDRYMPDMWRRRFFGALPVWLTWWLLTPLVVFAVMHLPITGGGWKRALPLHALGVPIVNTLHSYIVTLVDWLLGRFHPELDVLQIAWIRNVGTLEMGVIIYLGIAGVAYAVLYSRAYVLRRVEAQQLEALLARERAQALHLQLQPHFMFNTLNTISSLMAHDVAAARRTMTHLSDLLRSALADPAQLDTSLEHELDMLHRYIAIQRIRFGDRITFDVDVADMPPGVRVPRLLLQPLVENAVRHGLATRAEPGRVSVRVAPEGADVCIEVSDDGVGLPPDGVVEGIGLRNTRERLEFMMPGRYEFVLTGNAGGGATARVCLHGVGGRE